jgi:hydroxycarboxylate dehydrogenase B
MLTLSAEKLTTAASAIFEAAGTPSDIAAFMASSLVGANLAGHDSHGVIHIPTYVAGIKNGGIVPDARPEVVNEGAGIVQVDGGWGFGQYGAHISMDLAIKKAKQGQIALVTMIRAGHIGRVGQWVEEAAQSGVIGMAGVSFGNGPFAATPFGGAGKVLSTNPLAIGAPLPGTAPFVSDFATTAVAEGKLRVAKAKGMAVPDGWLVDAEGRPTNDVDEFYNRGGMLQTMGGHKGYALSLAVEIMSIALSGADTAQGDNGRYDGAFFIAIDPSGVRPLANFTAAAGAICDRAAGVPPAPGSAGVLIPGQPEDRNRQHRLANGIELAESTWEAIQDTARELGAPVPN